MKSRLYRLLARVVDFDALIARHAARTPDFIVWHDEAARVPYLQRWWLIPRNPLFNIYLHHITQSDDDRALHDHRSINMSIVVRGGYDEVLPFRQSLSGAWDAAGFTSTVRRSVGDICIRLGHWRHRLVHRPEGAWTIFITLPNYRFIRHNGRWRAKWGFYCREGFIFHEDFTGGADKGAVGRGCA